MNNMDIVGIFAAALVFLALLFLTVWSLIWVYRDAKKRGHKNAGHLAFLCFLCNWPFSLIFYISMRKEPPAGPVYQNGLNSQGF